MAHQSHGLGPLFDPLLRIEDLAEHLREASANRERPEILVDLGGEIVLPLLDRLGWDVDDGSVVKPGFQLSTGVIDFALCVPPGNPQVLVKIGGLPGNRDPTTANPFDDCTLPAIQLAVSEDARIWRLHFPAGRGKTRNREFARFELVPESAEGMAQAFDRFLARPSVESGEAWQDAKQVYGQKRFVAGAHRALRHSLQGKEILQRFEREMEEAIGVAVDGERAKVRSGTDCIDTVAARSSGPESCSPSGGRRQDDSGSREIVQRRVVDRDPDVQQGEVSRDSPFGDALIGAHEGEEMPLRLPGQPSRPLRIILIGDEGRDGSERVD